MPQATPHGSQFRPGRYFFVMGRGWYAETREGPRGPYASKDGAERLVERLRTRGPRRR